MQERVWKLIQKNKILIKPLGNGCFSFPVGDELMEFCVFGCEVYLANTLCMDNSEERALLNTRAAFKILKAYNKEVYNYTKDFKKIDYVIKKYCKASRCLLDEYRHSKHFCREDVRRENRCFSLKIKILQVCDKIKFLVRHKELIKSYVLEEKKELCNDSRISSEQRYVKC